MRNLFPICFAVLAFLVIGGCETKPADTATMGANPPIGNPVGPVPGVMTQPVGVANPYANDNTAMVQGRKWFLAFNCYGCHGGRAGGGMGPSLRDKTWIYGDTDADIFNSIAQGRGKGMPAWGTKVTDQQIWELVAYIKTLNTDHEVDPPPPVH